MKRELKCGHCATNNHERLPAYLRPFCDKQTAGTPAWLSNRKLRQKTIVAAELKRDFLKDRLDIKYDPSAFTDGDPDSIGHQYVVTTCTAEWLWCCYADDRSELRPQIAKWLNDVALWFAGQAENVADEPVIDSPVVGIYDVTVDGELKFRTLDYSQAKAYAGGSAKAGTVAIFEHVVKLNDALKAEMKP